MHRDRIDTKKYKKFSSISCEIEKFIFNGPQSSTCTEIHTHRSFIYTRRPQYCRLSLSSSYLWKHQVSVKLQEAETTEHREQPS